MKRYEGVRTGRAVDVTANGQPLDPRLELRNHSPTGFEWGYGGSGPAQLALAILADYLGDDTAALERYQRYKEVVVVRLPYRSWVLTSREIEQVLEALQ